MGPLFFAPILQKIAKSFQGDAECLALSVYLDDIAGR